MLRRFSINFALLSMLLDAVSVAMSLWLASELRPYLNRFAFIEPMPEHVDLPGILYILFPFLWVLIYSSLAIYDGRKHLRAVDEFSVLSLGMFISAISSAGILYFSYRDVSRALYFVFVVQAYLFSLGWRALTRLYFRTQKTSFDDTRRILIVGAGSLGQQVHTQIKLARTESLSVVGFVGEAGSRRTGNLLLGGVVDLPAVIAGHGVTDVVIALPHSGYHQLGELVQSLDQMPVRIWVALGFFDLALYKTAIEDFAGIPMLDLRASAIDGSQRLLKRAFDILLGCVGLVFALPVIGLCALAILLDDGLPVLYRQKRVGENGRLFEMLKLRTMIRNADQMQAPVTRTDPIGNNIHKIKDDIRITRVGHFLRRFSLDELPQFINVVQGDMSLVGPRPEMPYLVDKYQPWQRKRFAVPPGLTGWWQVNGRSDRPMHLHTEDDLYYIQNYSIWLDIQILMRTVWVVLIGKGSY